MSHTTFITLVTPKLVGRQHSILESWSLRSPKIDFLHSENDYQSSQTAQQYCFSAQSKAGKGVCDIRTQFQLHQQLKPLQTYLEK